MKKALVEEKINSQVGIMKGKSFIDELEFVKYEGLYKEVEVGHKIHLVDNNESITPTTDKGYLNIELLSKKLIEFKKEQDAQLAESMIKATTEASLFVKKYSYDADKTDHSQVLRFGINKKYLADSVIEHNALQPLPSTITSNTNDFKTISTKTLLHPAESNALDVAIEFFTKTNNKTVLIDVLKRDSERKITDIQDTHTVVLYNTEEGILVIDPSNPQFSSHLANFKSFIQADYSNKNKIYGPVEEKSTLGKYLTDKYKSVTGINYEQYRDCIDIAVKIAFGLNEDKVVYKSLNQIYQSHAMKYISNEDTLDKTIFYKKDIPNKIKQSSDIIKVQKYNAIQQAFDKKTKMILKDFPVIKDKYYELYTKKACLPKYDDNTIQNLLGLNQSLTSELSMELNKGDLDLLGKVSELNSKQYQTGDDF